MSSEDFSRHLTATLRDLCGRIIAAPANRRKVLQDIARTVVERLGLVACSIRGRGEDGKPLMEGYVRGKGVLDTPILEDTEAFRALYLVDAADEATTLEDVQAYTVDGATLGIRSRLSAPFPPESGYKGAVTFFSDRDGPFSDRERRTLSTIVGQVAIALQLTEYREQELDQALYERDLELAVRIQRQVVPERVPDVRGLEIATLYRPFHSVGGDLFDLLPMEDGSLCVVIGDVAGKGLPAALLMMSTCSAIRALIESGMPLDALPSTLNRQICRYSGQAQMVTLFLGVISPDRRTLRYFNAGHPAPVLAQKGTSSELASTGIPLGLFDDQTWSWETVSLDSGCLLTLYTDAVTDTDLDSAETTAGDQLRKLIRRHHEGKHVDLAAALSRIDSDDVEDDCTVLLIRVDE